ncbi:hypothetical protein ACFVGN_29170 [Streptomyces sp. NPDC057757]|uniref:hypothetical protein n=1 Tax=Streptomyces sp. NPDC057757 TaxID=3346241 RepID=UPI0036851598
MTSTQDALRDATNAYVKAEEAFTALMAEASTRLLTLAEIEAADKSAREAREAYAKELEAAGHAVPAGLLDR